MFGTLHKLLGHGVELDAPRVGARRPSLAARRREGPDDDLLSRGIYTPGPASWIAPSPTSTDMTAGPPWAHRASRLHRAAQQSCELPFRPDAVAYRGHRSERADMQHVEVVVHRPA